MLLICPTFAVLAQQGRFPLFNTLVGAFPFDEVDDACHAAETAKGAEPLLLLPGGRAARGR